MGYEPSTTTDSLCRDCAHMQADADGNRFCFSPQIMKANGRGTRCIFERDSFREPERRLENGTQKCGRGFFNFKRKEAV
jgi:hypothetical protein